MNGTGAEVTGRVHFLDTARAVAMLLGVPLHAAYAYQNGEPWLVSSPDRSATFYHFIAFIHAFRMHAFFVIAGVLGAMLVLRKPGWLAGRFERLGLPLAASLATVMVFQFWLFAHYSPATIARGEAAHRIGQLYVSHLWFLLSLIAYSAVLALVAARTRLHWPERVERWGRRRPLWSAFLAAGAVLGYEVVVKAAFQLGPVRALLDATQGTLPIEKTLYYAPYFALGVVLQRRRALFDAVTTWRPAYAIACLLAVLALAALPPGEGTLRSVVALVLSVPAGFAGSYLLLALARKLADHPADWVTSLVGASFTIFLFHHPLVILGDLALLAVPLPPVVEVIGVTGFALGIAWLFHLGIRRSRWLHWLFNGVPRHRPAAAPPIVPPEVAAE